MLIVHMFHVKHVVLSFCSFDELYRATGGFEDAARVGSGANSVVYRGTLNGTPVAIKWLDPQAVRLGPDFQQQAADLATLRHPNLLMLLGACPENGSLVYEYTPVRSLPHTFFTVIWFCSCRRSPCRFFPDNFVDRSFTNGI
jgi:hypothetical protein